LATDVSVRLASPISRSASRVGTQNVKIPLRVRVGSSHLGDQQEVELVWVGCKLLFIVEVVADAGAASLGL